MVKFEERFWDVKSFDELRKHCRQSNDFCKDVCGILHSRSKLEQTYAENLSQLALKASKCGKDLVGTLKSAWTKMAAEIENEAELHKNLAGRLNDDAVKELKIFIDNQTKTRKPVEQQVEKSMKLYSDKRIDEQKDFNEICDKQRSKVENLAKYVHLQEAKKNSHLKARDNESSIEQYEEAKSGKKKANSEKELSKLETKCKKAASSIEKADRDYKDLNLKAERGRIELASAIRRFSQICETTECERVQHIKELFIKYSEMLEGVIPQMQQSYQNVKDESSRIEPSEDINSVADQRGTEREAAEQLLTDYFEEDFQNMIAADRRKQRLEEKVKNLSVGLKREIKAREGIEHLFNVYESTPNYTNEEGQMNVADQLAAADEVINSIDGSLYKIQHALAQVNRQEAPNHRLSSYIQTSKDKQGLAVSVLKIPLGEVTKMTRADSNVDQGYPSDDEFDEDYTSSGYIGQCIAQYGYDGTQSDELTIREGDVINLSEKQDDDWWLGELNGKTGIFPATYVQEM